MLAKEPVPDCPIPPEVDTQLLRRPLVPLMAALRRYPYGTSGITREAEFCWVFRDERGRVIGSVKAIHGDPPVVHVGV
jgi:hypothetical protein